eukprot:scaffold29419_cov101-Isochrysis_galbana.AAC.1
MLLKNNQHVLQLAVRVAADEQPLGASLGRREPNQRARRGRLLLKKLARGDEHLVHAPTGERLRVGPLQVGVERPGLSESVRRRQHKPVVVVRQRRHQGRPVAIGVARAGHRGAARGKALHEQPLHVMLPELLVDKVQLLRLLHGIPRVKRRNLRVTLPAQIVRAWVHHCACFPQKRQPAVPPACRAAHGTTGCAQPAAVRCAQAEQANSRRRGQPPNQAPCRLTHTFTKN